MEPKQTATILVNTAGRLRKTATPEPCRVSDPPHWGSSTPNVCSLQLGTKQIRFRRKASSPEAEERMETASFTHPQGSMCGATTGRGSRQENHHATQNIEEVLP